ncbi:MAG: type III toxin-antitoxin system ToxN/AbiQ family toxin [Synergistaceae bacterium]|nr:type III toxin-antitoxin system ToxN/AbiQ family toxin [Synergistaceae bacterium]
MQLYYISDSYVEYLRNFDGRIYENKLKTRPYVGVVLEINDVKYYVALSSPKPKHKRMNNSKDFRKINGGIYGALNFNYMIPVPETEIFLIDIAAITDKTYKRLLQNQYKFIKSDWDNIKNTARNLYLLCCADEKELSNNDKKIKSRCCDFRFLEEKCKLFNLSSCR